MDVDIYHIMEMHTRNLNKRVVKWDDQTYVCMVAPTVCIHLYSFPPSGGLYLFANVVDGSKLLMIK